MFRNEITEIWWKAESFLHRPTRPNLPRSPAPTSQSLTCKQRIEANNRRAKKRRAFIGGTRVVTSEWSRSRPRANLGDREANGETTLAGGGRRRDAVRQWGDVDRGRGSVLQSAPSVALIRFVSVPDAACAVRSVSGSPPPLVNAAASAFCWYHLHSLKLNLIANELTPSEFRHRPY
jgi:hypothetical protein